MIVARAIGQSFTHQAHYCTASGAPFCGALLSRAAEDILAGGPMAALVAPWAELDLAALLSHAIALRWLGAVHDLALSGATPDVSAAFPRPDRIADPERAWAAVRRQMDQDPSSIAGFMDHEPQTNEVRRSALLIAGALEVAGRFDLPLRLVELGASAGLNQLFDRFTYRFGDIARFGSDTAAVRIDTDWRGVAPCVDAPLRVASREACDRKPIDLGDPVATRLLKAYVWADQFDRLHLLDAAVAEAVRFGVRVQTADAIAFVATRGAPQPGVATLVYHSIFRQYMPARSQADLAQQMVRHGAATGLDAPLAWLAMEPESHSSTDIALTLTVWPGGETRRLARCHLHGAWVRWGD